MRIFGSIAFVHVPKEERTKLDEKNVKYISVSYNENIQSLQMY